MTMNHTWGYSKLDHNWKSTETLLHNLCDIASKGGNYLLNVGPTELGEIPAPSRCGRDLDARKIALGNPSRVMQRWWDATPGCHW